MANVDYLENAKVVRTYPESAFWRTRFYSASQSETSSELSLIATAILEISTSQRGKLEESRH